MVHLDDESFRSHVKSSCKGGSVASGPIYVMNGPFSRLLRVRKRVTTISTKHGHLGGEGFDALSGVFGEGKLVEIVRNCGFFVV